METSIPADLLRYLVTNQKDLLLTNKNSIDEKVLQNLQRLDKSLIQPLERAIGSAATITSGYRCPELNKRVGGVPTSRHLAGLAADLSFGTYEKNREAAKTLLQGQIPFDQCKIYGNGRWLHVGLNYPDKPNRHQILK